MFILLPMLFHQCCYTITDFLTHTTPTPTTHVTTTSTITVICSFADPLFTVDNSEVILSDSSLIGHLSHTLVGNNADVTFTNVDILDLEVSGHVELTKSNFTATTDVEFNNFEGKVFDEKSDSNVEGLNVIVIDIINDNDPMMITDYSTILWNQAEIINSCVRPAFVMGYLGHLSWEVILSDSSLIGHLSQTLVGINNSSLITLVNHIVDFDVSNFTTDFIIYLETVFLRYAADGHFELTKTTLTMNNVIY
ncbi:hypothetical protein P9112_006126 [Eukaryota sp. TZLM1-RC]